MISIGDKLAVLLRTIRVDPLLERPAAMAQRAAVTDRPVPEVVGIPKLRGDERPLPEGADEQSAIDKSAKDAADDSTADDALLLSRSRSGIAGRSIDARATESRPAAITTSSLPQSSQSVLSATPLSVATHLSDEAVVISRLLSPTIDAAEAPPPARQTVDVSAQSTADAARTLARVIGTGGLFYESHLREWADGQRPLEALRSEPQNRLPPADDVASARAAVEGKSDASTSAQAAARTIADIPAALLPIVREQLEAIDTRRLHWQGEVWPQQTADIEIEEQPREHDAQEEAGAWRTTLRVELPQLGLVEARILLHGTAVSIGLHADAEAMTALRSGDASFRSALHDAGVTLRALEMHADEMHGDGMHGKVHGDE